MGRPGEFEHPDVIDALKHVRAMSEKMNVASGFHVISPEYKDVLKKIKEGYSFIAFSLDTLYLGNSCKESMMKIKSVIY